MPGIYPLLIIQGKLPGKVTRKNNLNSEQLRTTK